MIVTICVLLIGKTSGALLSETLLDLDEKEPIEKSSSIAIKFNLIVLSDMLSQSTSQLIPMPMIA